MRDYEKLSDTDRRDLLLNAFEKPTETIMLNFDERLGGQEWISWNDIRELAYFQEMFDGEIIEELIYQKYDIRGVL